MKKLKDRSIFEVRDGKKLIGFAYVNVSGRIVFIFSKDLSGTEIFERRIQMEELNMPIERFGIEI